MIDEITTLHELYWKLGGINNCYAATHCLSAARSRGAVFCNQYALTTTTIALQRLSYTLPYTDVVSTEEIRREVVNACRRWRHEPLQGIGCPLVEPGNPCGSGIWQEEKERR